MTGERRACYGTRAVLCFYPYAHTPTPPHPMTHPVAAVPIVVGILKQKGGVGATTIAVHLALAAERSGRRVLIVDVDPQQSARSWANARGTDDPPVIAVPVGELANVLEAAAADGVDVVLVDTPPHSSDATAAVARLSALALVPVQPSAFDLAALPATLALVRATRTPALVVLNRVPSRAREADEARAGLAGVGNGVGVWPGQIGDRTAFRRTVSAGLTVFEAGGDLKARGEMLALWHDVARLAGTPTHPHTHSV